MNHLNKKAAYFLFATIAGAICCHGQEESLAGTEKDRKSHRFTVTVTLDLESFSGVIVHPVPPNTLTQNVLSHKLVATTNDKEILGFDAHDIGPAKKRFVALEVNSRKPINVSFTVEVEMRPGLGLVSSGTVNPLSKQDQDLFTGKEVFYGHEELWFRAWIRKCNLHKGDQEGDANFALRVLKFMRDNFTYSIPDNQEEHDEKARRHRNGGLGLSVEERTGECLALSRIYASVLRANGIPSRQISGRMLETGDHHVRAQIFLPVVGWMHVEVAGAVSGKQWPLETFFGRTGDRYLAMNEGINFLIRGPKGTGRIGTFSYFGLCGRDGSWEWPKGEWSAVEQN